MSTSCYVTTILLILLLNVLETFCESKFFHFVAKDIKTGNDISFQKYEGKVVLIVNVASECSFTDLNYKQLVQLQKQYDEKKFAVIGFPCNQFGEQEPKDNSNIWKDVNEKFQLNFDLYEKTYTIGKRAHPLYQWLKSHAERNEPTWNFSKYLLNQQGEIVRFASAWVSPMILKDDIENLLAGKVLKDGLLTHENIVYEDHKHTDL